MEAVPLRVNRAGQKKASLWPVADPGTSRIDEHSLLTEEDKQRKSVDRADCDTTKANRKPCKNCTCGLADVYADEPAEPKPAPKPVNLDALVGSQMPTSSCGNCYLGDAFRCASCPYLGLPAFQPGQKVEIGLDMDDI